MNLRSLAEIAQPLGGIFSFQQLKLYEPDFLHINLIRRHKQGYIKRITKGRYLLSSQPREEIQLYRCSNQIYQPSYISMESALRQYDLIPEGVYTTTACTTKKTQTLSGDMGTFYYYHLKPSLFRGYSLVNENEGRNKKQYLLAQVEKAICDFFYLKPHLTEQDFSELRIDRNRLWELTTPQQLQACAIAFQHSRLLKTLTAFISFTTS
jgi:predicted transcriptional regulator of viral defense system